jgi:hypothetical protein
MACSYDNTLNSESRGCNEPRLFKEEGSERKIEEEAKKAGFWGRVQAAARGTAPPCQTQRPEQETTATKAPGKAGTSSTTYEPAHREVCVASLGLDPWNYASPFSEGPDSSRARLLCHP